MAFVLRAWPPGWHVHMHGCTAQAYGKYESSSIQDDVISELTRNAELLVNVLGLVSRE